MLRNKQSASSLFLLINLLAFLLTVTGLLAYRPEPAAAQTKTGWSLPKTISNPEERATDPFMVADPHHNRLHVFWASERMFSSGDNDTSLIFYAYLDLAYNEWSTPVDILRANNGQDAFAPRGVLDGEGTIHLFFSAPEVSDPFGPVYYTSAPAERAGSASAWMKPAELAHGSYMSDVKIDSLGNIHLLYGSVSDGNGICHLLSADNGHNWEQTSCFPSQSYLRDQEAHTRPRLAIDQADHLHVVWMIDDYSRLSNLRYGGRALLYARSRDGGTTWENIHTIDQVDGRVRVSPFYSSDDITESLRTVYNPPVIRDVFQPEWPYILVDHHNRIHIIWIGSEAMTRMHMWSADGGDNWTKPIEAMPVVYFNGWMGLINDSSDTLHYVSAGYRGVWYTHWTEETGWAEQVNIDNVGPEMGYVQMVELQGNRLFTVYQKENDPSGGGGARTVLVTELNTGTTGIPYKAPPVRQLTPRVLGQVTPTPNWTVTPTLRSTFPPDAAYRPAYSPAAPILFGLVPVLIILGAVIFVPMLLRRHG